MIQFTAMPAKLRFLLIFLPLVFLAPKTQAQSVKALYEKARFYAYNDNRDSARSVCKRILRIDPEYTEAMVLMGRTYAWDKQYENSRHILNKCLEISPENYGALSTLFNTEYWSDNYPGALEVAKRGTSVYPSKPDFYIYQAKVYSKLEEPKRAAEALSTALDLDPTNEEALSMMEGLKKDLMVSRIQIQAAYDYFPQRSPGSRLWQQYNFELSHRFEKVSLFARLQQSRRFGRVGHLLEFDAYPKIRPGTYAYLNYGFPVFEPKVLYPEYRYGAEIFQKLPWSMEFSLGMRHLQFGNAVDIITASVGKYYRSYWFSVRTFITPKDVGVSNSYQFMFRNYYTSANDFFGVTFGTGFSPDQSNLSNETLQSIASLRAYSIRLERQWMMGPQWGATLVAGVQSEEVRANDYMLRLSASASLNYRF